MIKALEGISKEALEPIAEGAAEVFFKVKDADFTLINALEGISKEALKPIAERAAEVFSKVKDSGVSTEALEEF